MEKTHRSVRLKLGISRAGAWLLTESRFETFQNSTFSSRFWLSGNLGVGKTVLTSSVVDHMQRRYGPKSEGILAYYYCSGTNGAATEAIDVLGGILRQLAQSDGGLEIFEKWRLTHNQSQLDYHHIKVILRHLIEYNGKTQTTIIIDALDEVNPDNIQHLMDTLDVLLDTSEGLLKVFVSSRDNPPIRMLLCDWPELKIDEKSTRIDLEFYIDENVDIRLGKNERVSAELRREVKLFLKQDTKGVYVPYPVGSHRLFWCFKARVDSVQIPLC